MYDALFSAWHLFVRFLFLYKIAEVWKWIEKMKRVKPEVCLCVIYLLYLLFTDIYYDMFSIELCERYKELHYV